MRSYCRRAEAANSLDEVGPNYHHGHGGSELASAQPPSCN